eukprot:CAMPEP_0197251420 /NCGR_PEP_ID=MMETSP1429-20130617/57122_1 /TAXON_ID=49237 /ORGANISM="Chaetoceros  sp., Strain UNC1202" /LENGTH=33 /DNA_ID= /DNA_START= /DNA_END= /DNA_ORIENTATION=
MMSVLMELRPEKQFSGYSIFGNIEVLRLYRWWA